MPRGEYGRRGLSPLIATVLLIAFAAAIGTMIINWTVGADVQAAPETDPCEGVSIALEQLPSGEAICYDAQAKHIRFVIINEGPEDIGGVYVRASSTINSSFHTGSKEVSTGMAAGEPGSFSLEYETLSPTDVTASILPIASDIGSTRCADKEIKHVSVPMC